MGNNNDQDVSENESSCKPNIPAIGRYKAHLGEVNHVKTSSLGSEPRTVSKSGSLGCSVPEPGYGGGLHGFAPGPHYV